MLQRTIIKIKKRDGRLVDFEPVKIANAIAKALQEVGERDGEVADRLAEKVVDRAEEKFPGGIPGVEDIQDMVEEVLISENLAKTAKAYILYRQKRNEIRETKKFFVKAVDELKLTVNAVSVLERRYLKKNEKGEVAETPKELFSRVAKTVASVDAAFGKSEGEVGMVEKEFFAMLSKLEFLPNSPTLMNAGTSLGQLSACFVLPVDDSIDGIFESVKNMALIHQTGGGTGFSFSKLRPKGDIVRSTMAIASGPVSFIRVFDVATDVIKQGGRRRGANMGILRVDHPDVMEFISSKVKEGFLANFNISLAITDRFMEAYEKDERFELINPRNGEVTNRVWAKDLLDMTATYAWKTGDPGLTFMDEIDRYNPTPHIGTIESTNPCGEQPLLPYESCNLGSINLIKMLKDGGFDWEKLRKTVCSSVHFLDNVIDANKYTLSQIDEMTKGNRKIGLGVMGFADALIELGLPYDSEDALDFGDELMSFISREGKKMSEEIAIGRGSFLNFRGSIYDKGPDSCMRNSTVTTIAPTGTISIIAGCSSGIEPLFAVSFVRNVMDGTKLLETNQIFERVGKEKGFLTPDLQNRIAQKGSVQGFDEIPADVRRIFVTAPDISPEWHVRMQAVFQKHADNSVSKTINLPSDSTVEDVKKAYLLAHKLNCKGITVFRYGSKREQVLYVGEVPEVERGEIIKYINVGPEYSGGCPDPYCPY